MSNLTNKQMKKLHINPDKLQAMMINKHMTGAELSRTAGVTTRTIYNIRNGITKSNVSITGKIAQALGVDYTLIT